MTEFAASFPHATCDPGQPPVQLKLGAPATCATPQLVTLIGGRRDCHLPIQRPEVSKVHCAIVQTGRGYLACDLGTRTGTYINDKPIRVAPLTPGDKLRVGSVEVDVELTALPAEASSVAPDAIAVRLNGDLFDLAQTAVVAGRRGTCDLVLDTPDVSLAHALVFAYRAQPVVFDLGSRSGTYVNGRRVHLAPLRNGDRLSIGGVEVSVECPSSSADQPIADVAVVPAGEGAAGAVMPAEGNGSAAPCALGPRHQAAADELAAARQELERRARDLDRRAAELDALGHVLALESEHLKRLKADRLRREAEIEQADKEARDRLALAVAHEQAATAAWEELERWRARQRKHPAGAGDSPAPEGAERGAFLNVVRPYPLNGAVNPPTARTGSV